MYFQNDEGVSLPLPLDVQLSQDVGLWEQPWEGNDVGLWEHSYSTVQELPGATDYLWMGAEHSGTHLPQVPLDPFEPSQNSRVPQVPRDQSAVSVPTFKR